MVKGLGAGDEDDDAVGPPSVELTEVGVTDTFGLINPGVLDFFTSENSDFCSLAADKPNTISSSLRRFFSLPTTGSSAGQLFFFISFPNISSSLLFCLFFEGIEKSCTSFITSLPLVTSVEFIFGRPDDRSIGVRVLDVPGITAGPKFLGDE